MLIFEAFTDLTFETLFVTKNLQKTSAFAWAGTFYYIIIDTEEFAKGHVGLFE